LNSQNVATLPLSISVCGFETISQVDGRSEFYFQYDSGNQYLYKAVFEKFFALSHSECPITTYGIEFNQTIQMLFYPNVGLRILLDENEDILFDTNVQEEHDQLRENLLSKGEELGDVAVIPFNLTATTSGNVKFSMQLAAFYVTLD
jgi:hypothetical protein